MLTFISDILSTYLFSLSIHFHYLPLMIIIFNENSDKLIPEFEQNLFIFKIKMTILGSINSLENNRERGMDVGREN